MFGLDYFPAPWSNNVWTPWIKHMLKHTEDCGVQQAAMVKHQRMMTVACSKNFVLSTNDVRSICEAMEDKTLNKIRIKDKTYTLLPRSFTCDPSMLIAELGDKYVVIGTSHTMYIVLQIKKCKTAGSGGRGDATPDRVRRTLELTRRVVERLAKNDY